MNRLIDYFPDWMTGGGIFSVLSNLPGYTPPWAADIWAPSLDIEYFGNRSGSKITSPVVDRLIFNGSLSRENVSKLAQVLISLYGDNWSKLWNTLKFEYDPIENYNMIEDGTQTGTVGTTRNNNRTGSTTRNANRSDKITRQGTDTETPAEVVTTTGDTTKNDTITRKGTATETPAEVVKTDGEGTTDKKTNVFGFNSDEPGVPSNTENGASKTTETVTHSGTNKTEKDETETQAGTNNSNETVTHSGTNTTEKNETETQTGTDAETVTITEGEIGGDTRTDDLKHTLNRHGNIGVTTSQQMIQAERELWFWVFFDVVFDDLDKILTSPIY